jgi:hypothetical protein
MIPFGKDVDEAKTATLKEVKDSYIALAASLGKDDKDSLKIIDNFFGKEDSLFSG